MAEGVPLPSPSHRANLQWSDKPEDEGQMTVIVKNTFLDVETPKAIRVGPSYQSCPVAAFTDPTYVDDGNALADSFAGISEMRMCDLAAAAQMFSKANVSREEMESKGLIGARGEEDVAGEFTAERTWGIDDHVEIQYGAPSMLGAYHGFSAPPPPFPEMVAAPPFPPSVDASTSSGGYGGARKAPPPLSELIPEMPPPGQAPQVGSGGGPAPGPAPPPSYTPKVGDGAPPPPCWTPKVGPPGGIAPPPTGPTVAATQPLQLMWYRVAFSGGVALRAGPSFESARTGAMLYHNETFSVSQTVQGNDGRIYLLLADGRGWAFDDSAIMTLNPSVVRGRWEPGATSSPGGAPGSVPQAAPWSPFTEPGAEVEMKKRRRRKRGGVKRNKAKRAAAAAAAAAAAEAEGADAEEDEDDEEDGELDAATPYVDEEAR